jgi:sarcosine oxidase subunit beta
MKSSAEVVIIGGGIAGCTTAYYLAKKGVSDIILLEKSHLTSGATGGCAGGVRTQLSSDIKIKLAQGGRKIFSELKDELQYERDLELDENGYLSLVYSDEGVEDMKSVIAFQKERGVPVEFISIKEAKKMFPTLSTDGIKAAVFHSEGGIINPHLTGVAFAEAARRLGVSVYTNTEVTGVKTKAGKVTGVITNKGEISARKVVNAAGLGFGEVSKMAGIDVPVNVEFMEVWVTGVVDPIESPSLTLSWTYPFFVFTQRKSGNLVIMGNQLDFKGVPKCYRDSQSSQKVSETASYILSAFPMLKDVKIIRHYLGPIPTTTDNHPILGETDEVKGFYLEGLLCGHGFLMGPMIGKVMAETMLGEKPTISIDELNYKRFEAGKLLETHALL